MDQVPHVLKEMFYSDKSLEVMAENTLGKFGTNVPIQKKYIFFCLSSYFRTSTASHPLPPVKCDKENLDKAGLRFTI